VTSQKPSERQTDWDAYIETYKEEVDRSISFIGQSVDYFTEVKARLLVEIAGKELGAASDLTVLDVGCGLGRVEALVQDDFKEMHGVDITEGVIETASRTNPSVSYQVYDGSTLPFDDGHFDLTFAMGVLHHVPPPSWESLVGEMARVTRREGMVMIFEHNPLNPLTRRAVDRCEFDADATLLRMRTTIGLVRRQRMTVSDRRYIVFFPFGGARVAALERALARLPLGAQYIVAARSSAPAR
jgi:SAM-dependent methyltransferase